MSSHKGILNLSKHGMESLHPVLPQLSHQLGLEEDLLVSLLAILTIEFDLMTFIVWGNCFSRMICQKCGCNPVGSHVRQDVAKRRHNLLLTPSSKRRSRGMFVSQQYSLPDHYFKHEQSSHWIKSLSLSRWDLWVILIYFLLFSRGFGGGATNTQRDPIKVLQTFPLWPAIFVGRCIFGTVLQALPNDIFINIYQYISL